MSVIDSAARDATGTEEIFRLIMTGGMGEDELVAFLTAQFRRGPTEAELIGAARAMRAQMKSIETGPFAIDLCGTGGDGKGTLNISTAVSLVVAGAGVPVAKHGNRSMSSQSGAADILETLGVKIALEPEAASLVLRETGIVFLFAPAFHPAMRHVAVARKRVAGRTIFNLLGPLASPARVRRQLVGIFAREWLEPYAAVLRELGSERAWVVHGRDGLDELTTTDTTDVAMLEGGKIALRTIAPEDAGLKRSTLAELKGGTPQENAAALRRLLDGETGAYRDIVLLNAAAAFIVADKAKDLREGAGLAAKAIDSDAAKQTLEKFVAASNR